MPVPPLENLVVWLLLAAGPAFVLPFAVAVYAHRDDRRSARVAAAFVALFAAAFAWVTRPVAGSAAPLVSIQRWLFVPPLLLAALWSLAAMDARARRAAWGASVACALLAVVTSAMALDTSGACD